MAAAAAVGLMSWYERHRYALLFGSLLATIAFGPLLEQVPFGGWLIEVLLGLSLLAGVVPIRAIGQRRVLFALIACGLLLRFAALQLDMKAGDSLGLVLWGAIAIVSAYRSLRFSLSSTRVDAEHLYAALSTYLLVGVFWGAIYVALEQAFPGSLLFGGAPLDSPLSLPDGIYFSFVTLATLGYGDFAPGSPIARGLAIFEAIFGQLYLAVMVARLVSLLIVAETNSSNR